MSSARCVNCATPRARRTTSDAIPPRTRHLIERLDLLAIPREYAVVTGSKGKGSTTVITACLLRAVGYRVGTITSPHLVTWRERIRVDGRAIPEPDFLRILGELAPAIDGIEAAMSAEQYFSPTGIFLALALRWFGQQGVEVGVLEVGRGGRFDDIALVPNHFALFSPITLEHQYWLGPTLERIAWHKAGILKPGGLGFTVAQPSEAIHALEAEAELQQAKLEIVPPAKILGPTESGWRMAVEPLGSFDLPLLGRYQATNVALAIRAAGAIHVRLGGTLNSPDYIDRIRAGLAQVRWPGRLQKLQDSPAIYLDGAVNHESARSVIESLQVTWTHPLVSILAVPEDKDYAGVYEAMGRVSDALILTETERNPILHFPDRERALALAQQYRAQAEYAPMLEAALARARNIAGAGGTIVILGTQSIVADTILLWGATYEEI